MVRPRSCTLPVMKELWILRGLAKVLELLQRQGRVSYRALKLRFELDDEYLEDLKAELCSMPNR